MEQNRFVETESMFAFSLSVRLHMTETEDKKMLINTRIQCHHHFEGLKLGLTLTINMKDPPGRNFGELGTNAINFQGAGGSTGHHV